jgi:hypothetical protein
MTDTMENAGLGSPDSRADTVCHADASRNAGTQQDRTVTQSRFLGAEYPEGTVLIWRTSIWLATALRDDRIALAAGLGEAHWWFPTGASTWEEVVSVIFAIGEPDHVVRLWTA